MFSIKKLHRGVTFWIKDRGRNILASVLDPIVTSGTMFLVQGAVLVSVSKPEFASYSLASSYATMGQAVMSSLFGGPLLTLLGEVHGDDERKRVGTATLRLQLVIGLSVGLLGCITAIALRIPVALSALTALSMVGLSFRDALRSVLAARFQFEATLFIALKFSGGTLLSLGAVWLIMRHVTAEGALIALAIGAIGTLAAAIVRALRDNVHLPKSALRRLMNMAVWSVPGAAVIWLQNSFYLTLVAINLSLDAVGEVSAARMVAMPILITASGLLRFAQVQASRKLANEGPSVAISIAVKLALIFLVGGFMVAGSFWLTALLISPGLLPKAHPHLLTLAAAWLAFAAATVARGFLSSLYQAMGRYSEIFVLNTAVLPFVLGGVVLGPRILGLAGAVIPMVAGELVLLLLLGVRVKSQWFVPKSTGRPN